MYTKIDKMIKDLEIRGRSESTIKNMVLTMKVFLDSIISHLNF